MTARPLLPSADYLTLSSKAFPPSTGHREFSALCGDDPPTITDGYAIWNIIPRPLLQSITVPAGYNPAQMKVSLRMGVWDGRFNHAGWDTSNDAGRKVESDIDDLHWMAGGNAIAGPSPAVEIRAINSRTGKQTHLVPRQYWGVKWVINGGIAWGPSLRNFDAWRVYQECSFTLLGYLGVGTPPPKFTTKQRGGYFKTTTVTRTIMAIAGSKSSNSPEGLITSLSNAIRAAKQNNPCRGSRLRLERKSITANLPVGLEVWVPGHQI